MRGGQNLEGKPWLINKWITDYIHWLKFSVKEPKFQTFSLWEVTVVTNKLFSKSLSNFMAKLECTPGLFCLEIFCSKLSFDLSTFPNIQVSNDNSLPSLCNLDLIFPFWSSSVEFHFFYIIHVWWNNIHVWWNLDLFICLLQWLLRADGGQISHIFRPVER